MLKTLLNSKSSGEGRNSSLRDTSKFGGGVEDSFDNAFDTRDKDD